MATTNDLKNGLVLNIDGQLWTVVEFQHVKPGKGGAFVRTKLRNVKTGNVFDRTFNAGVRVEQALVDKKDMQFLYRDGDEYVFMDTESYDQMNVAPAALGDAADYLVEQAVAIIAFYNGEIVTVEIPAAEAGRYDVIVAYRRNGSAMPVRDKGPLFIIYPFDSNPELRSTVYYSRSAWQLKTLQVL